MSEHIQLTLFGETISEQYLDDRASDLVAKLTGLTDRLVYGEAQRESVVYAFLERSDSRVSNPDNITTAVVMFKHAFVTEVELIKFFSKSSVASLKSGLLLLEAVLNLDSLDEDNFDTIFMTTEIIADELCRKNYGDFVDKHYSGLEFSQLRTPKTANYLQYTPMGYTIPK